jgi:hypothetical protein
MAEPAVVSLTWPGYRYLRLDLYHPDPEVLEINQVAAEWPPQVLVFEAKGPGPAFVFTGADGYALPGGELALRLSDAAAWNARNVTLGPPEPNPVRVAAGLSSYRAALLSVLLLVVGLLGAVMFLNRLRHKAG